MRINRIKNLKINIYNFKIKWSKKHNGGSFDYSNRIIEIGVKNNSDSEILMIICHELMELVAVEMSVRLRRPDCNEDYIFVYDHRQHDTMSNMFSSLLEQFLK